jgi:hypothetical protein
VYLVNWPPSTLSAYFEAGVIVVPLAGWDAKPESSGGWQSGPEKPCGRAGYVDLNEECGWRHTVGHWLCF